MQVKEGANQSLVKEGDRVENVHPWSQSHPDQLRQKPPAPATYLFAESHSLPYHFTGQIGGW
jgi:hypothetical protein